MKTLIYATLQIVLGFTTAAYSFCDGFVLGGGSGPASASVGSSVTLNAALFNAIVDPSCDDDLFVMVILDIGNDGEADQVQFVDVANDAGWVGVPFTYVVDQADAVRGQISYTITSVWLDLGGSSQSFSSSIALK